MSLPRLNRAMVLETPVRRQDGAGGHVTEWTAKGSLFVEVKRGAGRQARGEVGALSRHTVRVITRAAAIGASSRPVPGDRFREGSTLYRIDAVAAYDRGAHYLTCYTVEESLT